MKRGRGWIYIAGRRRKIDRKREIVNELSPGVGHSVYSNKRRK